MKKTIGVLVALAAVVALAGCNTANSNQSREKVTQVMTTAMCGIIIGCSMLDDLGLSKDDCEKNLQKHYPLMEHMNARPFRAVTKTQLDGCVAEIGKLPCEQFSLDPPAGCRFISEALGMR